MTTIDSLLGALRSGEAAIADLTAPLSPQTPILQLPPPFANTIPLSMDKASDFDDAGPAWGWNNLHLGEHTGTHLDAAAFLNADDQGPHTPGVSPAGAKWLAGSPITGFGVETVGIDTGQAGGMEPPFPAHNSLLGADKYGLTQLQNLDLVPASGALLVASPLPIVGGTGSPARAFAVVPA